MSRSNWLRNFILLVFICVAFIATLFSQTTVSNAADICETNWLHYEPAKIKLTGTLHRQLFYGPPNFGENPETDAKEISLLLQLPTGINVDSEGPVEDDFNVPYKCVMVLQLVFVESVPLLHGSKELDGTKATVSGKLFGSFTGHHHTEVLLQVDNIELAH